MEESIYFQAKDLMLGDWIKIGKVPLRVIQLTHFTHKDDSVVLETGSEYLDVEPIPITPEVLEKNGFKAQGCYKFSYMDNYCSIEILCVPDESEDGEIAYTSSVYMEGATFRTTITMEYVHELQHLLRLLGINEIADNFKV